MTFVIINPFFQKHSYHHSPVLIWAWPGLEVGLLSTEAHYLLPTPAAVMIVIMFVTMMLMITIMIDDAVDDGEYNGEEIFHQST